MLRFCLAAHHQHKVSNAWSVPTFAKRVVGTIFGMAGCSDIMKPTILYERVYELAASVEQKYSSTYRTVIWNALCPFVLLLYKHCQLLRILHGELSQHDVIMLRRQGSDHARSGQVEGTNSRKASFEAIRLLISWTTIPKSQWRI